MSTVWDSPIDFTRCGRKRCGWVNEGADPRAWITHQTHVHTADCLTPMELAAWVANKDELIYALLAANSVDATNEIANGTYEVPLGTAAPPWLPLYEMIRDAPKLDPDYKAQLLRMFEVGVTTGKSEISRKAFELASKAVSAQMSEREVLDEARRVPGDETREVEDRPEGGDNQ